jgi:hypothetical protein
VIELVKLWLKLPLAVRELVTSIVRGIAESPDPRRSALRIIEEESLIRSFDEAMRRAKP